jgi:hypothetical protein
VPLTWVPATRTKKITLKKLECSKQAACLNTLAWNNKIDVGSILLVQGPKSWVIGTVGGIRIQELEVKFLDFLKTHYCESICQGCFH